MSESRHHDADDLATRISAAIGGAAGETDREAMMARLRDAIGKAGSDVDVDVLLARVTDAIGKTEETVDVGHLRRWTASVDRETLRGWLDEARSIGAGAASLGVAQRERLVDQAPEVVDTLAGAAREKLGALTGDDGPISERQVERLKGQVKDAVASAAQAAKSDAREAARIVKRESPGATTPASDVPIASHRRGPRLPGPGPAPRRRIGVPLTTILACQKGRYPPCSHRARRGMAAARGRWTGS